MMITTWRILWIPLAAAAARSQPSAKPASSDGAERHAPRRPGVRAHDGCTTVDLARMWPWPSRACTAEAAGRAVERDLRLEPVLCGPLGPTDRSARHHPPSGDGGGAVPAHVGDASPAGTRFTTSVRAGRGRRRPRAA